MKEGTQAALPLLPAFPIRHRASQQEGLPARAAGPVLHPPAALGLDVCPSRCDLTCCGETIYKTLTISIKAAWQAQGWAAGEAPSSWVRPHCGGLISHTHTSPSSTPNPAVRRGRGP